MKKKKIVIFIISIILVLALGVLTVSLYNMYKNSTNLNLEESKWVEANKNQLVDISIMNQVIPLNYNGDGMIQQFLNSFSDKYNIQLNIQTYNLDDEVNSKYTLKIKEKVSEDDLLMLEDNYILVSSNDKKYMSLSEISNLKIGVLSRELENIKPYFNDTVTFNSYDNYSKLKGAFNNEVDYIIILKSLYTEEVINNSLFINYQLEDLKGYFVLELNGEKELNNIFKKYYKNWYNENYKNIYNEKLLSVYFNLKQISDNDQRMLKSKKYKYGFVNYGIYDYLDGKKLSGINSIILKNFGSFSSVSLDYTQYNSISRLEKDFKENKVDLLFNLSSIDDETLNTTTQFWKANFVVVTDVNNDIIVSNLHSLKNREISTIKSSWLEDYLITLGAKVKSYNNMNDLISSIDSKDIIIIDIENYNYYKSKYLKNSKISYEFSLDNNYNYIISNKENNKVFADLLEFYLSYMPINTLINNEYSYIAYEEKNYVYILYILIIFLLIYFILDVISHIKHMVNTLKNKPRIKMSKEDKIKYIDQLTSLKNRNYLNSKIESWDESDVYPQAIIVIDLNNVSYINDNYGREEGDKVITEAANILILTQLPKSEIIRTDGNEFLIYLVGYNEKQIISYLRKLQKEFKNLSHGFGAASGYSVITDEIKTIDDAVNEATLDMKNNKEEIDY